MTMQSNYFNLSFKNPVIAASGTFGFGQEYKAYYNPSILGGISAKGITLEARRGNSGIRITETAGGVMNSIGLENPGVESFLADELQQMSNIDTVKIANLGGSTLETYIEGARLIEEHNKKVKTNASTLLHTAVDLVELNISCPNVKEGGIAFGITCEGAEKVVREVRKVLTVPMAVKLSPNAENIVNVAKTCEYEGADGISLINTFSALKIDIKKRRPVFDNVYAGLSGPAIKPIALKMVREVAKAVKVPVIGMGGITTAEDAIEFIMAGAHLIQFGTASFINPYAGKDIVEGIEAFMKEENIKSLDEIRGII